MADVKNSEVLPDAIKAVLRAPEQEEAGIYVYDNMDVLVNNEKLDYLDESRVRELQKNITVFLPSRSKTSNEYKTIETMILKGTADPKLKEAIDNGYAFCQYQKLFDTARKVSEVKTGILGIKEGTAEEKVAKYLRDKTEVREEIARAWLEGGKRFYEERRRSGEIAMQFNEDPTRVTNISRARREGKNPIESDEQWRIVIALLKAVKPERERLRTSVVPPHKRLQ